MACYVDVGQIWPDLGMAVPVHGLLCGVYNISSDSGDSVRARVLLCGLRKHGADLGNFSASSCFILRI